MEPELVTLDHASRLFEGVTPRALRRLIKKGRLASSKPGRAHMVRLLDVREIFAPKVRAAVARPKRESESARIARQLAAAGIGD